MIIQIVRFKSGLSDREVLALYESRAPRYRPLKGLIQKYYLRYPDTGEHGAVYVWESDAALREFRQSDLGRTIAETYKIREVSESRMGEVVMTLQD